MATLYFNAAVDNDWNEIDNWWTNSGHTAQAAGLPTASDSVVATANISSNGGSEPTVVDFTTNAGLSINITATGMATFSGSGSYNSDTVTGNATFDENSNNEGTVTGDATFNDSAYNWNFGTVTGNATFNDSAYNWNFGTVSGNATFNDSAYNSGDVSTNATFNDSAYNANYVMGNATFNDSSYNENAVSGNATFNDSSYGISVSTIAGYVAINGNPVVFLQTIQPGLWVFSRRSGINGSSILGVV